MIKGSIKKLENDGLIKLSDVTDIATEFYKTCIDYLDQWSGDLEELVNMQWALLKEVPQWVDVEKTVEFVIEKQLFNPEFHSDLFDNFACASNYINDDKIAEWNSSKTPSDQRWVEVFTHLKNRNISQKQLIKLIQYIFCLPGTNASTERVFSQMNNIWTDDKSQLKVSTLKSLLMLKFNVKLSCLDFYNMLKSSPELLKKIITSEKYEV